MPRTRTLRIDLRTDRELGLVAVLLVDGTPILHDEGSFVPMSADEVLGTGALLPVDPPRRVALTECACGGGVGCANASVVISERRGLIRWTEAAHAPEYSGAVPDPDLDLDEDEREAFRPRPLDIADVAFDAAQYRDEVDRANDDERWRRRLQRRTGTRRI
ncbi:hypothetical protein [Mumia sp. DW29H23]|uniref:hypothetical protein n=1 Tax=Mumia sp. DW29H23 TaxID=3421241 RepID=UPI003D689D4A